MNTEELWKQLESTGLDNVRKKKAEGVYGSTKLPLVNEWIHQKESKGELRIPEDPERTELFRELSDMNRPEFTKRIAQEKDDAQLADLRYDFGWDPDPRKSTWQTIEINRLVTKRKEVRNLRPVWIGVTLATLLSLASLLVSIFSYHAQNESQVAANLVEARELLDEALDLMGGGEVGKSFIYQNNGSLSENEKKNYELAKRRIEKALIKSPEYYMAHEYLGLFYSRMGVLDEAEKSLSKAVSLTKEDWWPYSDLASVLIKKGQLDKADQIYAQAKVIAPKNPNLFRNIAIFYSNQGKNKMANSHYCKARKYARIRNVSIQIPEGIQCL